MLLQSLKTLVRTTPTLAPIPNRAVISVTGSQATEFLNGIVASTVPTGPNDHFYSTFLHAQGRVLYDVFVYANPVNGRPGHLIEFDALSTNTEAPPLLPMLKKYILRSKVRVQDVTDQWDVWAAWGSEKERQWETERQWTVARSGAVEPVWNKDGEWPWGNEPFHLRDRRGVGLGHRLLVRKGEKPQESSTHDLGSPEDYTLHRIVHGVPEGSVDIPPTQAFPMDSNLDIMGALDFRKGCYVGQELTVRTYHTGVVRKRIFPVVIHRPGQSVDEAITAPMKPILSPGLDIRAHKTALEDSTSTRSVRPRGTGKLLSTTQGVGLALLRLEHIVSLERGEAKLEFETASATEEGSKETWAVTPWRPSWWPALAPPDAQ
ncbi:Aminomethyltransferase folate-binding domain-containing protein [Panus rudis PR-1116 ss-1]|nr:Aminomethyltransferase folate-binding domain-containing protein [Panus rudis PR-1116 ss-1]